MNDYFAIPEAMSGCCPNCDKAVFLAPQPPASDALCPACQSHLWFLRKNLDDAVLVTFLPTTHPGPESIMRSRDILDAAQEAPRVVLDMSRVPLVQSLLLGVLVAVRRQLADADKAVRLCGLSRQVRETLQATQLSRLFHICDDRQSAMHSFNKGTENRG